MIRIIVTNDELEKYSCKECLRIYELLEQSESVPNGEEAILMLNPLVPINTYRYRANAMAAELLRHTCPLQLLVKAIVKSHRAKRISEMRFH